jgi:4-amino-4-deoxy-L-arabinose transferase-like glycosyltransferase
MSMFEAIQARPASLRPLLAALDGKSAAWLRAAAFHPTVPWLLLIALCCALYLPGIASLPVTDRDEARFAQASKQMLESGNYVDIRFQTEARYKKPIGIYWLQAAAVAVAEKAGAARDDIWAYRIPSFFGALCAVLLTFWAGRAVFGREKALIGAGLFAACLTMAMEAHIAKSDAALIATIALAQGALFRLYLAPAGSPTLGLSALFWLGLGAGILIKGPIAPGLAAMTSTIVLWRDARRSWIGNLHWKWGVPLLLAVTLPWFVAIGISSGGAFFKNALAEDFAGKLKSGQEAHWAPPGFYFAAFWLTFWPATLFAGVRPLAVIWHRRHERRLLFLLAWIVPWWIIIEAIPTKLPHYALPLYPAVAMTLALSFNGGGRAKVISLLWAAIAALQTAALIAPPWLADAGNLPLSVVAASVFALIALLTFSAAWRGYRHLALAGALCSSILFYGAAFHISLPAAKPMWISKVAAEAVHALQGCSGAAPGFAGYSEPSLIFLNGTKTVLAGPAKLGEELANDLKGIAFVNWTRREEFEKAFEAKAGQPPRFLGCVDGLDVNGKGPTRLQIYARPDSDPACKAVPQTACAPKPAVRWRRLFNTKF